MTDAAILALCGLHSVGFAAFHLAFWRLFRWREDLARTSPATRAITQILNLRLIYVLLAVAAACFLLPEELTGTRLGRGLLACMSLFWVGRLAEQFVFLRIHHWLVHALTALFALGAALFAWPLFR
ncbi:MAG TPA: hypothetical protein VEY50_02830 [Lysobacter sp.]|nr:hypothetical protein [Lysobacter sp.]